MFNLFKRHNQKPATPFRPQPPTKPSPNPTPEPPTPAITLPAPDADTLQRLRDVYVSEKCQQAIEAADARWGWTPDYQNQLARYNVRRAEFAAAHMNGERWRVEYIVEQDNGKKWDAVRAGGDRWKRRLQWQAAAAQAAQAVFDQLDEQEALAWVEDNAEAIGTALFANAEVDSALRKLYHVPDERGGGSAAPEKSDEPNPTNPDTWPAPYAWGMLNPNADTAAKRWAFQSHQLRQLGYSGDAKANGWGIESPDVDALFELLEDTATEPDYGAAPGSAPGAIGTRGRKLPGQEPPHSPRQR